MNKPLVLFVILSYNQEQYIEDALNGALAQTYEPLHILVSDDASLDKTVEKARAIANKYTGPHRVTIRKNLCNLGLIRHLNHVLSFKLADFIVLAAGDDISLPYRTETQMKSLMAMERPLLVHSDAFAVENDGTIIKIIYPGMAAISDDMQQIATSLAMHIGATAAIHSDIHRIFGPITDSNVYEDLIMGFRASLLRRIAYINEPLIKYRLGIGISSTLCQHGFGFSKRRSTNQSLLLSCLKQRRIDVSKLKEIERQSMLDLIDSEIALAKARLIYHENIASFLLNNDVPLYLRLDILCSEEYDRLRFTIINLNSPIILAMCVTSIGFIKIIAAWVRLRIASLLPI